MLMVFTLLSMRGNGPWGGPQLVVPPHVSQTCRSTYR